MRNSMRFLVLASLCLALLAWTSPSFAHCGKCGKDAPRAVHTGADRDTAEAPSMKCKCAGACPVKVVERQVGNQTECPVMKGKKIDKRYYRDALGYRVYFCCKSCPAKFRKDPAKYIKQLQAAGVKLEKTTTLCKKCGVVRGTADCCKKGADRCKKCKLIKCSPGCMAKCCPKGMCKGMCKGNGPCKCKGQCKGKAKAKGCECSYCGKDCTCHKQCTPECRCKDKHGR